MDVRLDDAFDVQAALGRFIEVDVHVAPETTTTARPVVSSPIRYEACDRQAR